MSMQINALRIGANIVVGTPGRVLDLIERRELRLGNLKFVVLDEADVKELQKKAEEDGDKKQLEKHAKRMMDTGKLLGQLNIQISQKMRNEVIASLSARNLCGSEEMNPGSHIPMEDGLLNLQTWELEPFSSRYFYTYQVHGKYLRTRVTLKDTPRFERYLHDVFHDKDIPLVISYMGYCLQPDFPKHKVLFVLGRERMGKGVIARLLKGIFSEGYGTIELARLLEGERFQFTGLLGKNVVVDPEIKRRYRKGLVKDWGKWNEFFGEDTIQIELKGREGKDYTPRSKGIFLGNLPFFTVDSSAAIARMLLIIIKDERNTPEIPHLDKVILEHERDEIVTLLLNILRVLKGNRYNFPVPREMNDREYIAEQIEWLADPTRYFVEEMTQNEETGQIGVKEAYETFCRWTMSKGISVPSRQTFTTQFGKTYEKKKLGPRGDRKYYFTGVRVYDYIDTKLPDQMKLDTGQNARNARTTASADTLLSVSNLGTSNQSILEEEHIEKNKSGVHVPKLDTEVKNEKSPVIQAPPEQKVVSNLHEGIKNLPSESDDDFGRVALGVKQILTDHMWHGRIDKTLKKVYLRRGQNEAVVHFQNDIMSRMGFSLRETTEEEMSYDWTSNYEEDARSGGV